MPLIAGFMRITRVFRILSRILRLLRLAHNSMSRLMSELPPVGQQIKDLLARLDMELETLPSELDAMGRSKSLISLRFERCKANILYSGASAFRNPQRGPNVRHDDLWRSLN